MEKRRRFLEVAIGDLVRARRGIAGCREDVCDFGAGDWKGEGVIGRKLMSELGVEVTGEGLKDIGGVAAVGVTGWKRGKGGLQMGCKSIGFGKVAMEREVMGQKWVIERLGGTGEGAEVSPVAGRIGGGSKLVAGTDPRTEAVSTKVVADYTDIGAVIVKSGRVASALKITETSV